MREPILDEKEDSLLSLQVLKYKKYSLLLGFLNMVIGIYNRYNTMHLSQEFLDAHPLVCFVGFSESDILIMILIVASLQFGIPKLISLFLKRSKISKNDTLLNSFWGISILFGIIIFLFVLFGWDGEGLVHDF